MSSRKTQANSACRIRWLITADLMVLVCWRMGCSGFRRHAVTDGRSWVGEALDAFLPHVGPLGLRRRTARRQVAVSLACYAVTERAVLFYISGRPQVVRLLTHQNCPPVHRGFSRQVPNAMSRTADLPLNSLIAGQEFTNGDDLRASIFASQASQGSDHHPIMPSKRKADALHPAGMCL
jgi:hypothetical protein